LGDSLMEEDGQVVVLQKPRWSVLLKNPIWLVGVAVLLLHSPLNMLAIHFAPQSTFLPLSASMVLLNFCFAYGISGEKFTKRDIQATLMCVLSAFVMNLSMPMNRVENLDISNISSNVTLTNNSTAEEYVALFQGLFTNVGFTAYLMTWCALVFIATLVLCTVSAGNVLKPFALPLLVGLLQSQFHFIGKIAFKFLQDVGSNPSLWADQRYYFVMTASGVLYLFSSLLTVVGCRNLAMRYFVPAVFVSVTCFTIFESLLFFREWTTMEYRDIWVWAISEVVCIAAVFFIEPTIQVIAVPPDSPRDFEDKKKRDVLKAHRSVLSIIDEYKMRKAPAKNPAELNTFDMSTYGGGCVRVWPLLICLFVMATPVALFYSGLAFSAFTFLTVFQIYSGWKMGIHIALFAYVGIKKIIHYKNSDFKSLYQAEKAERNPRKRLSQTLAPLSDFDWNDLYHFVILPNYKEDEGCLAMAIQSVANSGIAKDQIVLVLAMEDRENWEGKGEDKKYTGAAKKKAERLSAKFKNSFHGVVYTEHPGDLKGETPGKSANTKWAASVVFGKEQDKPFGDSNKMILKNEKYNYENSIITVGDADSEFHSEYFAALTYHFLLAGGEENETPARYTTIWQAPILHYKNYLKQPVLVRLASFITSEHELSNLADPNSTRVPYSTYSLSANLAQAVNGWDPDWISEDWHMCLKCFMATKGKLRVLPIFLPVSNYAPEGEGVIDTIIARWDQAKRHAMGFSEIAYFIDFYPRVRDSCAPGPERRDFRWKSFFLFFKLLMIHLFMAVFFVVGPFNGYLVYFFVKNQVTVSLNVNSWTFLINCIFQAVGIISFIFVFIVSVHLYDTVRDRIDGACQTTDDGTVVCDEEGIPIDNPSLSILWRSRILHVLGVVVQSLSFFWIFLAAAAVTEWIAAFKTALRGHRVEVYDVAAKPKFDDIDLEPTT